jgi:hypothetical protein
LVQIGHGSDNNTLVLKAAEVGQTVLKVCCEIINNLLVLFRPFLEIYFVYLNSTSNGRDRMVVGFITICAISAYHH